MATIPLNTPTRPGARQALRRLFATVMAMLALSVLAALVTSPAQAQIRSIPPNAQLGTLTLGIFPDAVLNGKAIRLGPGARIYNQDNIIIVPSTQKDVTNVVAFVTGSLGEVVSVWILKDAEIRQLRK